jgi:hypothetical protein
MLQPTTARECKSSTAAKYNQPSCVPMYVITVTQIAQAILNKDPT